MKISNERNFQTRLNRWKKFRRLVATALTAAMLTSFFSCSATPSTSADKEDIMKKYGENYRKELEVPQENHLFGMCYLAYEGIGNGIDYRKGYALMGNLGVQSVRSWMHFGYLMRDYKNIIPEKAKIMHEILAEQQKYGIFTLGLSHTNWSLTEKRFVVGKPKYEYWEGSDYKKWLDCYEESWYTLVAEFPEVTYWEIDNEINNKDFMYTQGKFGEVLPTETMAKIAADMLYYGSRGIHRANKNAVTVMGGLVDPIGLGTPTPGNQNNAGFLEVLYDEIESGEHGSYYPDDFFQTACWHPYYYTSAPDDYFWEENDKIYEVILRREGKNKKVFFSELGWDENLCGENVVEEAATVLFENIKTKLPYVESVFWFRAFDNVVDNHNSAGLFYDPNPAREDVDLNTGKRAVPGAPKKGAFAYQKAAGGSGSLTILKQDDFSE